jgi:hypothetical protein
MPDTHQQITGKAGAEAPELAEQRDQNGRFRPGVSGNPAGRPPGSLNRATRAAAILLDGEAEALTRKAIEMALEGNAAALRLCFDRIHGRRRGRPVALYTPPLDDEKGLAAAAVAVAQAAVRGTITPEEGISLIHMLQSCGHHVRYWRAWDGSFWKRVPQEPSDAGGSSPDTGVAELANFESALENPD